MAGESTMRCKPRGARATALRIARSLLECGENRCVGERRGISRDKRDTVETADASPLCGRRNRYEYRARQDQAGRKAAQRLRNVSATVFKRENRGPQAALVRPKRADAQRRKPNVNPLARRRTGSAKTAAEHAAARALRRKDEIEQWPPDHAPRSRRRGELTRDESCELVPQHVVRNESAIDILHDAMPIDENALRQTADRECRCELTRIESDRRNVELFGEW